MFRAPFELDKYGLLTEEVEKLLWIVDKNKGTKNVYEKKRILNNIAMLQHDAYCRK